MPQTHDDLSYLLMVVTLLSLCLLAIFVLANRSLSKENDQLRQQVGFIQGHPAALSIYENRLDDIYDTPLPGIDEALDQAVKVGNSWSGPHD